MVCTSDVLSFLISVLLFPCLKCIYNFETPEIRTFLHNVRVTALHLCRFNLLLMELQKTQMALRTRKGAKIRWHCSADTNWHKSVPISDIFSFSPTSWGLFFFFFKFLLWRFEVHFQVEWSSCVCAQFNTYELVFCCIFQKNY